jgi:penicillin-binding protein-related factor A (putative recombinase)
MKRGAAWELQLMRWHDTYRKEQRAVVWKTCAPVVMHTDIDRRGRFSASYSGQGPPDFIGYIGSKSTTGSNDRSIFSKGVVFDAKEVSSGRRLPLSMIQPHQARDLEAAMIQGCHSGICAHIGRVYCWFNWHTIGPKYWDQHPSVHVDDGITFGEEGWLSVL